MVILSYRDVKVRVMAFLLGNAAYSFAKFQGLQ